MRTSRSALLSILATAHTSCLGFTVRTSPTLQRPNRLAPPKQYFQSNRLPHDIVGSSSYSRLSVSAASTEVGEPGTADLPWDELGFEFRPTKSHLRMVYRDGKWGEEELVEVRLMCCVSTWLSPMTSLHDGGRRCGCLM